MRKSSKFIILVLVFDLIISVFNNSLYVTIASGVYDFLIIISYILTGVAIIVGIFRSQKIKRKLSIAYEKNKGLPFIILLVPAIIICILISIYYNVNPFTVMSNKLLNTTTVQPYRIALNSDNLSSARESAIKTFDYMVTGSGNTLDDSSVQKSISDFVNKNITESNFSSINSEVALPNEISIYTNTNNVILMSTSSAEYYLEDSYTARTNKLLVLYVIVLLYLIGTVILVYRYLGKNRYSKM